jgi:hypothetical protein
MVPPPQNFPCLAAPQGAAPIASRAAGVYAKPFAELDAPLKAKLAEQTTHFSPAPVG